MKEDKELGFNREDSAPAKDEAYKAFTKDKRKRINSSGSERIEYRKREFTPGEHQNHPSGSGERRSYNPNFTADNRPAFEKRGYDDGRNPNPGRRDFGNREYGNRDAGRDGNRSYGQRDEHGYKPRFERDGNSRPEYGNQREYGDRKEYAPRGNPYGERREYTPRDRSYGERREYNQPREYNGNRYGREAGERREYAPRREYNGERDQSQRREYTPRDRSAASGYGERRQYTPREGASSEGYGQRREYTPRRDNNYGHGAGRDGRQGFDRQGGQGGYGQRKPYGRSGDRGGYAPRYNSENYPTFPAPAIEDKMRLNRYVAMSGICSRREADEFILSGVVTVNDIVVTEMGAKVCAEDVVKFNGNIIQNEKKVYIVMNKPKGYVTSVEDPHAEKTVMDLLKNGCRERVYPVGRLDKSSLGVLLITNDGDLAKKLTHPSFEKKKVYQVTLDKPLTKADMDSIVNGISLDDGEIHADAVSYVMGKKNEIGIEIHSGRNRIVRRIFEHLGYRVNKLDRVYFAGLTKQRLKRGEWRFLSPREVQALQSGRYE